MELKIENVDKYYGRKARGIESFSLTLTPGVVGFLGPNGAGKSTLMNILATLIKPSAGQVLWNDSNISHRPNQIRQVLGYLPQNFGVYPNLTGLEFLNYIAAIKGLPRRAARQRVEELLQTLNLAAAAHRPLGGYSGGMRQRIGIAQALLNDPQLLILDEPTVGLDPGERVRFRNLIADLSGERIIILSTHIVSDLEATASQIALIAEGRLLGFDTPENLLQAAEGQVWDWVIPSDQLATVRRTYLMSGSSRRVDGLHVRILQATAPDLTACQVNPTLEDAYILYTKQQRVNS